MLGGEGCGCLGGQFVELGGGYARVDSLDDLLGDDCLVDKLEGTRQREVRWIRFAKP